MGGLSVAILTGGRARRMDGRAKGLIEINGTPIIRRLTNLVQNRASDIFFVGQEDGAYASLGFRTISDAQPNKGAPGGLYTALISADTPWVMVLPCDVPYLNTETLDRLQPSRVHDAILYRVNGRQQPLVGLWNQKVSEALHTALKRGNPSLNELAEGLNVKWIETTDERPFFNLNSHADLAKLKKARS